MTESGIFSPLAVVRLASPDLIDAKILNAFLAILAFVLLSDSMRLPSIWSSSGSKSIVILIRFAVVAFFFTPISSNIIPNIKLLKNQLLAVCFAKPKL